MDTIAVADTDASKLNTNMIGTYAVTYSCPDLNSTSTTSRIVNVVDTTNPSIALESLSVVEHSHGTSYQDTGATCTDNYDPDRHVKSDDIVDVNTSGQQTLRYTCIDSSGNAAMDVTRTVIVTDP